MIFNSMANLWSGSNGINILPPGGGILNLPQNLYSMEYVHYQILI